LVGLRPAVQPLQVLELEVVAELLDEALVDLFDGDE
jgi:hypothetical protein